MAELVRVLRAVVACPSDVTAERARVRVVVDELNRGTASLLGLRLEVKSWDIDAHPGFHANGPQGLIDPILDISSADIVIGIFWRRFGTPGRDGLTGTEHELLRARDVFSKTGRPQLMLYFCERSYTPRSKEEAEQWGKVLTFKESFTTGGMCWAYKGVAHFETLLRNHLTAFLNQLHLSRRPVVSAAGVGLDGTIVPAPAPFPTLSTEVIEPKTSVEPSGDVPNLKRSTTRDWVDTLSSLAAWFGVLLSVAAFSGWVAAWAFDRVIDRPAVFSAGKFGEIVVLGVKAMVLPFAVIAVAVASAATLQMIFQILPGISRRMRVAVQRAGERLGIAPSARPVLLARAIVLGMFLAAAMVSIAFGDVQQSYFSSLSEDDLDRFAPLTPEKRVRTLMYRLAISATVAAALLAWTTMRFRLGSGTSLPASVQAGAVGGAALLIVLLQAPYKLMTSHNEFPVVLVEERRCYLLGQHRDAARVYCPSWAIPRVRTLPIVPTIRACRFEENLFLKPSRGHCFHDESF